MDQATVTDETKIALPLRVFSSIVGAIIFVSFMAAVIYSAMSFNAEKLEARIAKLEHVDERANEALEARLDVWNRERRENAAFQAKIMEKLDRIERKIGP